MKTTILIPTDFSVSSLILAGQAVANAGDGAVGLVFTHCLYLPDSITELLFFSKKELLESLETDEFKREFKVFRRQCHPRPVTLRTELFTGRNQNAFNNFVEGNGLTEAVIPTRFEPERKHKRSFSPIPFIRKSGLKITEVDLESRTDRPDKTGATEWAYGLIRE